MRSMIPRPEDDEPTTFLQEIEINVGIGNVKPDESEVDIVQAFLHTEARTLLLKRSLQLPNPELWRISVQPFWDESYRTEKGGANSG